MNLLLSIGVGVLIFTSVFLILQPQWLKTFFGISLLGHATNLLLFLSGSLKANAPAFIKTNSSNNVSHLADPIPQALVLTAIVIGFGLQVFLIILSQKSWNKTNHRSTYTLPEESEC